LSVNDDQLLVALTAGVAMTAVAAPTSVAALLLCAVALLVLPQRPRLRPAPPRPRRPPTASGTRRRAVSTAIAVAAVGMLAVPDRWWLVTILAAGTGAVVANRPAHRSGHVDAADRRLVAVHADLLASCLDAGMAVGPALRAVSDTIDRGPPRIDDGGPMSTLDAVVVMLSLGADAETAWRAVDLHPDLAPLAAAARRSAAGGGRLADAAREHAAFLRGEDAAARLRAAGRAGVLMTAPLGLCFLPAFLCLGLAPVVLGLLGQLDVF
jgi:hypothetical protein